MSFNINAQSKQDTHQYAYNANPIKSSISPNPRLSPSPRRLPHHGKRTSSPLTHSSIECIRRTSRMHRPHRLSRTRTLHRLCNTLRNTRLIIINGTPITTPAQDILISQIALARDSTIQGYFIGIFLAIAEAPSGKEVELDHHDLVDGAEEGDLPLPADLGVRHQRFDEDVLDVGHAGVDVDVFDIEGVHTFLAAVHHSGRWSVYNGSMENLESPTPLCSDTARNPCWLGPGIVGPGTSGETSCVV